jgi:hypothetical protein
MHNTFHISFPDSRQRGDTTKAYIIRISKGIRGLSYRTLLAWLAFIAFGSVALKVIKSPFAALQCIQMYKTLGCRDFNLPRPHNRLPRATFDNHPHLGGSSLRKHRGGSEISSRLWWPPTSPPAKPAAFTVFSEPMVRISLVNRASYSIATRRVLVLTAVC